MNVEVYGPGGFDPTKPNNNVVDTYTAPDAPIAPGPDARIAAAVTALATLDAIDAPVLPADVFDVLLDVRAALGGA